MRTVSVLQVLRSLQERTRPEFTSFTYTAKGSGEEARHTLIIGASMENVYRKDIETLRGVLPGLTGWEQTAAIDMIDSREKSIKKGIDGTNGGTYEVLDGIPGIKIHIATGALHVMGLKVKKKVFVPGTHPSHNHGPVMLAKKALQRDLKLPGGNIRQFDLAFLTQARMAGETLVLR